MHWWVCLRTVGLLLDDLTGYVIMRLQILACFQFLSLWDLVYSLFYTLPPPLFSKHSWCIQRCWNMLESSPATIPLIKSSHKWTRILFIISNSKLGIWLFSQPRIYLNSQSNFYGVLTIPYRYLSNTLYKTTCAEYNLHVSFTRLWYFHAIIKQTSFPLDTSLIISYRRDNG